MALARDTSRCCGRNGTPSADLAILGSRHPRCSIEGEVYTLLPLLRDVRRLEHESLTTYNPLCAPVGCELDHVQEKHLVAHLLFIEELGLDADGMQLLAL